MQPINVLGENANVHGRLVPITPDGVTRPSFMANGRRIISLLNLPVVPIRLLTAKRYAVPVIQIL